MEVHAADSCEEAVVLATNEPFHQKGLRRNEVHQLAAKLGIGSRAHRQT